MKFAYQAEKFHTARRALMLPHTRGESDAFMHCFQEISLAFHNLDRTTLDDDARGWAETLDRYMDTAGVDANPQRGAWATKADAFNPDDMSEISRTVDELAGWFDRQNWS